MTAFHHQALYLSFLRTSPYERYWEVLRAYKYGTSSPLDSLRNQLSIRNLFTHIDQLSPQTGWISLTTISASCSETL
jgi:hypothetical protein